jgi:hypothetical protein
MMAAKSLQNINRRRYRLGRTSLLIAIAALSVVPPILLSRRLRPIIETVDPNRVPLFFHAPHARFEFLQYLVPLDISSDVAELRHCNLFHVDWENYFAWASHILEEKMPQFQSNRDYANFTDWQAMEQEFSLELLEMYATHHGYCHYDGDFLFPPNLQHAEQVLRSIPASSHYPRLAIIIIAVRDAPQLQRLVEAAHMPQHYILIHLERRTSLKFHREVQMIASRYNNVVVVQFGTIVYRTDSVSMIQLQLMKWFVTKNFQYDFHVTLNGAAFSLYSAKELALHLQQTDRKVWMGELTNGREGMRVRTSQAQLLMGAKRLVYTQGSSIKGTFRVAASLISHGLNTTISHTIQEAMSRKSVSGNQAVYSFDTVNKLLASRDAMELFALAKYGCCGVLEERTWIAAMRLIGVGEQALENGCVWQVWGGQATCQSSVNNAILTRNESLCFKVEDGTMVRNDTALYIRGNQVKEYLKDAKQRGFLFARKFQSDNEESMALLDDIKRELHDS